MGGLILVVFYGSILFCVIASAIKIVRCASSPLHLHWELYRGSSVYELVDWWDKPHAGIMQKLKSIAMDVLFLKGYYQRDKGLWFLLYPFHLGIYLLILWHFWLFVGAITIDIEKASTFGRIWGHYATALAFVGGAGILIKRIADRNLRSYYPPIHYIKWGFILITLLGGFYAVDIYFDGRMPGLLKYVRDQVTFQDFERKLHPAMATASHVLFASVWLLYLPSSHIMKLFFRYYHQLRWDDVINRRGSLIESRIKELLALPVTWSGPHISSGKKWSEVASESGLDSKAGKP
jgi:nitrate reductase gamma subunit